MSRSAIAVSAGYKTDRNYEADCDNVLRKSDPKRVMHEWSTAYCLCLLAAGRIEGMVSKGAEIYDFAAGKLIAEEAGAIVTDFEGRREQSEDNDAFVVGCTPEIHQHLLTVCSELEKQTHKAA